MKAFYPPRFYHAWSWAMSDVEKVVKEAVGILKSAFDGVRRGFEALLPSNIVKPPLHSPSAEGKEGTAEEIAKLLPLPPPLPPIPIGLLEGLGKEGRKRTK